MDVWLPGATGAASQRGKAGKCTVYEKLFVRTLLCSSLQEEEEELLEELGYESSSSDSTNRDSLFLHLSFTLSRGSLSLLTTSSSPHPSLGPSPLVSLSFSSLCSSLHIRPRVRGATFELSLGGLSLNDEVDDESVFPYLIKPKGNEVMKLSS